MRYETPEKNEHEQAQNIQPVKFLPRILIRVRYGYRTGVLFSSAEELYKRFGGGG